MNYFVELSFLLFDNIFDIILDFWPVIFIKLKKHLLKLMKTDEFMFSVELINTSETTKTTGLTLLVETDHENFFVVACTLGTASINLTIVGLHEW